MICEKCKEQGLKSKVYINPSYTRTPMPVDPDYYDEDGNFVKGHDPNTYTRSYYCSNGHSIFKKICNGVITIGYESDE